LKYEDLHDKRGNSNGRISHAQKALEVLGPYLSERAWGTVREDYSPHGNAWESLPHDHARSRAYRWNEDGLAGIRDRRQMICFALALWNERDPRRDLILFHEYFHGDSGSGMGASHPTGWTGVVTKLMQRSGEFRERKKTEPAAATVPASRIELWDGASVPT
jgi:hypothetical protein